MKELMNVYNAFENKQSLELVKVDAIEPNHEEVVISDPLGKRMEELESEVAETKAQSINGDLDLMSQQFDLDFRIFEIETTLDISLFNSKGAKNMAVSIYKQAQTLILAGKYEREDMEYKLARYLERNRITKAEYDELISMMDAQELMN